MADTPLERQREPEAVHIYDVKVITRGRGDVVIFPFIFTFLYVSVLGSKLNHTE